MAAQKQVLIDTASLASISDTELDLLEPNRVTPSFAVVGLRRKDGAEVTDHDLASFTIRHPGVTPDTAAYRVQRAPVAEPAPKLPTVPHTGAAGPRTLEWAGAGTAIAVVDFFGVKHHDDFVGRLTTLDATGPRVAPWPHPPDGPEGTAVASVAAGARNGVAPAADILSYRAKTVLDLLKALAHIRESRAGGAGPRVVVTACEFKAEGPIRAQVEQAVLELRRLGTIFLTAIGNLAETTGIQKTMSLASCAGVLAVGAYEKLDNSDPEATARDCVHFWSSYGDPVPSADWRGVSGVQNAAPGFLCWAGPYVVAGSAPGTTNDWVNAGNTSMAVAFAAGSVASWLGRAPHLGPNDVDEILKRPGVCQEVLDYYAQSVAVPEAQGYGALRPSKARAAIEARLLT